MLIQTKIQVGNIYSYYCMSVKSKWVAEVHSGTAKLSSWQRPSPLIFFWSPNDSMMPTNISFSFILLKST
jgi:hypothetical protein